MRHPLAVLLSMSTLLLTACSGGGGGGGTPSGWQPLMTGSWTLNPHSEDTSDLHVITVDRDMYIVGIRPIAPIGTHHTVLYREDASSDTNIIYAAGLGTGEVLFPPGVGLKLLQGEQLGIEFHIFNVEDTPLSGTSGVEIIEAPASEVVDEADVFLPGPMTLAIPPSQTSSTSSTCAIAAPQSLFAMIPHMHQLGSHFKTTAMVGGNPITLYDADYRFDEQYVTPFASPIALAPGDSLTTECTWNNTTTNLVEWGESSTAEMCFTILYRWPAGASDQLCP